MEKHLNVFRLEVEARKTLLLHSKKTPIANLTKETIL